MRFGLTENVGWFPGTTIKVAPFDDDPFSLLGGLTQRAPTDAEWNAFMARARINVNSVLGRFFTGGLDAEGFGDQVYLEILRGHGVSVAAGRMRSGVFGALNDLDREVALFHGQQQGSYLEGFVRRLKDKEKRYWDDDKGEWKKGVINRDLQMYVSRYRGSANISFEAWSPEDSEFYWRLGIAEHCEDCLELAADNPHMKGELPVFPGDGGTACIVNCKCWLERGDGVKAFKPDPGVGKWIPNAEGQSPLPGSLAGEDIDAVVDDEEVSPLTIEGAPVSAAIKIRESEVSESIKEAVAVIDSVHADGRLPKIASGDFYEADAIHAEGFFIPSAEIDRINGKKIGLLHLNPNAEHPQLTVAHEMGHVLEIELLGAGAIVGKNASTEWNQVGELLRNSVAVGELISGLNYMKHQVMVARIQGDDAANAIALVEHLEYLLMPEEIWARAYAQFIASMSKSRKMKSQLLRSIEKCRTSNIWRQWEKDDFEPIRLAIIEAMIIEGWIE